MRETEFYHDFDTSWITISAIALCFFALLWMWIPTEAEKDTFRTVTVNPPALGHWIHTPEELQSTMKEILVMADRAEEMPQADYTPEMHLKNYERIVELQKSLMPIDGGLIVFHGFIPAFSEITNNPEAWESGKLYRNLQLQVQDVQRRIINVFNNNSTLEDRKKFAEYASNSAILKKEMTPVIDSDYRIVELFSWIVKTHIKSMFLVFFFFLIRAEIIGQRHQILFLDAHKTLFWMLFWPIGIWRYPTNDPVEFVRVLRHRLAMALTFLFTVALPNFAMAQSKVVRKEKVNPAIGFVLPGNAGDESDPPSPKNSISIGVQGTNKYHSTPIGEIFDPHPAARYMGRYTRSTTAGNFYIDSWNSLDTGRDTEHDIGGGYSKSWLDVFFAHYVIGGGDVETISVTASGAGNVLGKKVPLSANLAYYFGTSSLSPPGGAVLKLSTGSTRPLPGILSKLKLQNLFALGVDHNPFRLGKGTTAIGIYTAEVDWKEFYISWTASTPLAGRGNTTRGFRDSFSLGYRHSFAW